MNPLELLQQANLKSNMNELQNQLQALTATGSAGGELVQVVFNGAMEVKSVKIDPIAVDPRDVEMLEQLVASAITDAQNKIKQKIQSQFKPDCRYVWFIKYEPLRAVDSSVFQFAGYRSKKRCAYCILYAECLTAASTALGAKPNRTASKDSTLSQLWQLYGIWGERCLPHLYR